MNAVRNRTVQYIPLGLIEYTKAWVYQEERFQEVIAQKLANRTAVPHAHKPTPNFLITCMHPPVFTLGRNGKEEHLLLHKEQLQRKGITFHHIDRGGDITYHGPGQLVMYPILDLENFFTDIHRYLRLLEEALIHTLKTYGIQATRIPKLTGVWVENKQGHASKIAALGVRTSHWVTMHGLAFNIAVDLQPFDYIIPCGIRTHGVCSLHQLLQPHKPSVADVEKQLLQQLQKHFDMEIFS